MQDNIYRISIGRNGRICTIMDDASHFPRRLKEKILDLIPISLFDCPCFESTFEALPGLSPHMTGRPPMNTPVRRYPNWIAVHLTGEIETNQRFKTDQSAPSKSGPFGAKFHAITALCLRQGRATRFHPFLKRWINGNSVFTDRFPVSEWRLCLPDRIHSVTHWMIIIAQILSRHPIIPTNA